jgi:hypothetical protein
MASIYVKIPPTSGGMGAVDSVNGKIGVVVISKTDVGLGNVNNTSDANKPISAATQTALDAKQDSLVATADNQLFYQVSAGVIGSTESLSIVPAYGSINYNKILEPDDAGSQVIFSDSVNVEPLQNSPDERYTLHNKVISLDSNDSGFSFGTNGNAVVIENNQANNVGSGSTGEINFIQNYLNIGNGTDPISLKGLSYAYGFGDINPNVTINGPIQGYGFQPTVDSGAVIDSAQYTQAFYDASNINTSSPSYNSFNSSPQITSINNNSNYTGINVNPNIPTFTGNAGAIGLGIFGTYGTFNTNGYFQGISINPTISSARDATGISVTMNNVTPYAGAVSTLSEQDLTFTFNNVGNNNNYTLEYIPGATAGSEVISLVGTDITVQIEDGVSTATQIKAAMDAVSQLAAAITITVSGVGSNPQDIFGPSNFINGENPGNIKAAFLDGDVEITGNLSFGGALSIGKLNAFATETIISGSGTPASIHNLVSNPTVGNNQTITLGDTIGVNTAMLLTVGTNSTVTSALVGLSALALPAVVNLGAGSTVDRVAGATFAISLDAGASGTISNLDLCRAVGLPNGTTTVTNLKGYAMDLPFGDPGTTTWGFYESPGVNNYFAGNLLIGGTAGSDDTVSNSNVALEIKSTTKAFLNARMTTAQRDALTAVDGMQIYNTTTDKLQVRAAGSWVDLH